MQGCRDGHFVFASRLGSLSTVFTWLRSRACAGMQGLGVLALVVVAPCGFAAHVAPEEAVLSSPRNHCERRKLRNLLHPWGPCPYHLPPQNQSPWTPPPEPLHVKIQPPTPQGPSHFSSILCALYASRKVNDAVAKFAPSLGPVPLPPTPPESPRTPPPEPQPRA